MSRSRVAALFALVVLLAFASTVGAQEPRVSIGGAINVVTQTHADDQPLGGTTIGGSAVFGVLVSPRLSIEFEPSFGGSYSWEYTYRPSPSLVATVVASRRDMFFPVQARFRAGMLEPVVGVGVLRSAIERHATLAGGRPYFDDGRADYDVALVGGLDVAISLGSNAHLVPTFRVRVGPSGSTSLDDPLGSQTSTGAFNVRYGVGARVTF